jgi:hypothetical protein
MTRGGLDVKLYYFFNLGVRVVKAKLRPLYPRKKDQVPIIWEIVWAPGPVWTGAENLAPIGIPFLDCPARSEFVWRLRYPGSLCLSVYGRNVTA